MPVPSWFSQGCLMAGLQPCLCSCDLSGVTRARPISFATCSKVQSGNWHKLCSGWKVCSSCSALLSGRFKQSCVGLPMLLVVIPVVSDQAAPKAKPLLLQAAPVPW